MADQRQPHWLVPVLVAAVLALLITWLGLNDWRFPFLQSNNASETTTPSSRQSQGLTAPIQVTKVGRIGIDIRWSAVNNPSLHGYDVYVTAVRPIQYEYEVPRYQGDSDVTERHYPIDYLNKLLVEANDARRVQAGQVWYVCVRGMKETPLNVPIDPYIIPGTKACSDEFTLP